MSGYFLDELDIMIIRNLQSDARTPFKDIADACDVSTDTVKNRYRNMVQSGVVKGTTVIIDPKRVEKRHIVLIGIQVKQPYANRVIKMVKAIPGITAAARSMGRYDIEAIAVEEDIEQIGLTKETIGDFQHVANVDVDILVDKPLLCPKNFEFEGGL